MCIVLHWGRLYHFKETLNLPNLLDTEDLVAGGIKVDGPFIKRFNRAVPRYTSYPTAPQFYPLQQTEYRKTLLRWEAKKKPLSLYIHIPFCKTMCLFCACSVVLNRDPKRQKTYVETLSREIDLLPFFHRPELTQVHFGGGTPTSLKEEEFVSLVEKLKKRFFWQEKAEISIEIDPRTVSADGGIKLKTLRALGFNRVSFGVQDLDPKVQEAVRRRQSEEVSEETYRKARALGFSGINLDLIYGLPYQTVESFTRTAQTIASWQPDRIALFSYARVPWIKPHQKAIAEETLPQGEEKLRLYLAARSIFMKAGYVPIGMDHFARREDPLTQAFLEKKLTRNFQGYSLPLAEDLLGLGMSAIGFVDGLYAQNEKDLESYQRAVFQGRLPVKLGYVLDEEDKKRRWVIQSLMCHFSLDKEAFQRRFQIPFEKMFDETTTGPLLAGGLLVEKGTHFIATPLGELFIRHVASAFDAHFRSGEVPLYSSGV